MVTTPSVHDRVQVTGGTYEGNAGVVIAEEVKEGVRQLQVEMEGVICWIPEAWLEVRPAKGEK